MTLQNKNAMFSKHFIFLAFAYFTAIITTTVSANYFFSIGSFYFAGGIFIFPFSFIIGSIIGEVYNYSYQRIVIITSIIFQLIFVLYTKLFIHLTPAPFFQSQNHYLAVYNSDLRYFVFAVIGLYFAEMINVYFLTKWKCKSPGVNYMIRAFICITISQLGLSIVVNVGAFVGKTGDIYGLIDLSASNYLMKLFVTSLLIVPSYWVVNFLKKIEQVTYYDVKTKFEPFSPRIHNVYNHV